MASITEELLGTTAAPPAPSVTDELLGPVGKDISNEVDYLSGVLSRRATQPTADALRGIERQVQGGVMLSDLPLENYNPHDDKWSDKGTVDFATLIKAETVDDPGTKLRIYASALFPDEPDAVQRFGMVEGVPIYLANDGKLYRATPGGVSGAVKEGGAALIGHGPSLVMGGLGGLAAGGPPGAIGGAVVGAAGGEGVRKIIGNLAFDEPQTPLGNAWEMTKEGFLAGGGALLGQGLARWINRGVAKDIDRMSLPETQRLEALSNRYGFPLTPAEKTNLPSLRAQQKAVGNLASSADTIDEFLKSRHMRGQEVMDDYLNTLSPEDSIEQAGRRVREASFEAMEGAAKERAEKASPLYQRAFGEFKRVPKRMEKRWEAIGKRIPESAIREAQEIARYEGLNVGNPKTSLRGMHYVKLALDRMIRSGKFEGVEGAKKHALQGLQRDLVSFMDEISPKDEAGRSLYAMAREIYAHNSPGVQQIREGVLGNILDVAPDSDIRIPKMLLDAERNGPLAISKAMRTLRETDSEAANQALRAFLQGKWDEAGKEYLSRSGHGAKALQGARMRAMLMGNKRQQEMLQAAMTGDQWKAFNELMDLFEASGRAPMAGSDTAWNQEIIREMRKGGALGKIANAFSPQDLGNKVSEWLKTRGIQDYAAKTAEIITSPDNIKLMRELRKLPYDSQRRLILTGALLGVGAEATAIDETEVPLGSLPPPQGLRQPSGPQ